MLTASACHGWFERACEYVRGMDDLTSNPTFPFGSRSTPRPPRRPCGDVAAFVLGVYPSALHVRWTLPSWWPGQQRVVGALAVADEPTVFWDGADAEELVAAWKESIEFREGDDQGDWGTAAAAGNGTSGRPVRERVLRPLGADVDETWFTDAVDRFFVKRGGRTRQQGDVIDAVYQPFAIASDLPSATIPPRPTPARLVEISVIEHRHRLRTELTEASAPVVITLGEEARQVLIGIADESSGPPMLRLDRRSLPPDEYGEPGTVRIGDHQAIWHAVVHPGNRDRFWSALHDEWIVRRTSK
jgi:hypothetical protein